MSGRDFRAGAKAGGLGFRGLGPPVFHLAGAGIFTLSGRNFRAGARAGCLGFRGLGPPFFIWLVQGALRCLAGILGPVPRQAV